MYQVPLIQFRRAIDVYIVQTAVEMRLRRTALIYPTRVKANKAAQPENKSFYETVINMRVYQ